MWLEVGRWGGAAPVGSSAAKLLSKDEGAADRGEYRQPSCRSCCESRSGASSACAPANVAKLPEFLRVMFELMQQ
jgi:hypothetical protein